MARFLEKIFRPIAIPHLLRYVIILTVVVFALGYNNIFFLAKLFLVRNAVLHGEVWRLVTWVFVVTKITSPFILIFYLFFLWFLGNLLESYWGTVRLCAYFFTGMVGNIAAMFLLNEYSGSELLIATLTFAAAHIAPNHPIWIFGIIPLRLKWVAALAAFYPVALLIDVNGSLFEKIAVLFGVSNYLVFFAPTLIGDLHALIRRKRFARNARAAFDTLHCCARCGATEVTASTADFRMAADGNEYCEKHLPK